MNVSEKMKTQIKKWEGCRLKAYKPVKTEQYYTIGYGHYGADVSKDMEITQEEADHYFDVDIRRFEHYVDSLGRQWTQGQYDALVSFAYNCGAGNLKKLTTGRTPAQIAECIVLYNKAGGKVLNGLTKRREVERKYFTSSLKSAYEIAQEVMDGKWGSGLARKISLTSAGYDYSEVQTIVNRLVFERDKNSMDSIFGH